MESKMWIFGQILTLFGWGFLGYALKYSKFSMGKYGSDYLFLIVDFPWTNLIFMTLFGLSIFLLNQSLKKMESLSRLYILLISGVQSTIGLLGNFVLISFFIDTFIHDFIINTPPLSSEDWIVVSLSFLWWPFAWASFLGLSKKRALYIIRSIWTTGGMFLLLEIFRSFDNFGRNFYFERFFDEFLSLVGFSLILLGGVIMEWSSVSTLKEQQI